jgi:DNA-binding NtrC family response regulator
MIASGGFREDLWFRLNVFPITLPPLRQRREDIPALLHHLMERKSRELKLAEAPVLAPDVLDRLMAYDWPGNVRELENLIERALIRSRGSVLSLETLFETPTPVSHEGIRGEGQNRTLLSLDKMSAQHIGQALQMACGKINGPGGAAQLLGLHPNTLRTKMSKLGIPYGRRSRLKP